MASLKILMVVPECRGMVQIGGLAEVANALSFALQQAGHDVRIAMPYYRFLELDGKLPQPPELLWQGELELGALPPASVFQTNLPGKKHNIPLYLIKGHPWFDEATTREKIYSPYNEPYIYFPAAVLRFLDKHSTWIPDIIHCHDYHTGILPVYLNTVFGGLIAQQPVRTIFTIHNLAFQGVGASSLLAYGGLPKELASYAPGIKSLEYHGSINILKGAVGFADMTTTVSENYAAEIQTPAQGKGLHGVLYEAALRGKLTGIVNGIDNASWDPSALEKKIAFSSKRPKGKIAARQALRSWMGLVESEDPLLSVRSRWSYQKGLELLIYAIRYYQIYRKAQIAVVAWGPPTPDQDPYYYGLWCELIGWAASFPERISFKYKDWPSTELHYAGSDMFLMPSLFEPCGLGQMEAMRYGAIPVVCKTGGLADTIKPEWGFSYEWPFTEPLDHEQKMDGTHRMVATLEQAFAAFKTPQWPGLMTRAMTVDNDWPTRVPLYEKVYQK